MIPPGKDASYSESIERMTRLIKKAGFSVSFDKIFHPADNLFSVLVCDSEDPDFFYTNGKGSTEEGAIASGLGEFIERLISRSFYTACNVSLPDALSAHYHPDEVWVSPDEDEIKTLMGPELFSVYYNNSERSFSEDLLQGLSGQRGDGKICCIPFSSESGNYFIPFVLLDDLYCTNGMASGNSVSEAKVQALSEIIERFVKFKVIREELTLPLIDEEFLFSIPGIGDIINDIKGFGGRIMVLDASLEGAFPVTAAVYIHPDRGVRISFGSHPCFVTSLERTLTEMFQGRALQNTSQDLVFPEIFHESSTPDNLLSHFVDSTGELPMNIFCRGKVLSHKPFDFQGSREGELQFLKRIIEENGFNIFSSDIEKEGLYYSRNIVPGMSEVYPFEELDNKIELNFNKVSQAILELLLNRKQDPALIYSLLEESCLSDFMKISAIAGFIFNKDCNENDINIAELKIRAAAALNKSEIVQLISWYMESTEKHLISPIIHYFNYYFNQQLQKNNISENLFSEKTVVLAEKILRGDLFPEASEHDFRNRYERNCKKFTDISDIFFNK